MYSFPPKSPHSVSCSSGWRFCAVADDHYSFSSEGWRTLNADAHKLKSFST